MMLLKILRVAASIIILPVTVLVLVPWAILRITNDVCYAWACTFPLSIVRMVVAVLLIGAGLALFLWTNGLFIARGKGTLAPWDPAQTLIIEGPYRYMRNPMIAGVLLVLLGEGVLFTSIPILVWFFIFLGLNLVYLPLSEERGMRARFGEDFDLYRENVPAWIPREEPWDGFLRPSGDPSTGQGDESH